MAFELTILGSNSALPAHGRHPTSQVLNIRDHLFMIDCGEAAQIQMMRYKVHFSKIHHIFISHLHGDHYFGLIGLITSYSLNQRSAALHIIGPAGLQEIIHTMLKYSGTTLNYELVFHPFEPENGKVIFENDIVRVESLVMKHRIPCSGFVFHEKYHELNILKEKIAEYQIDVTNILAIKKGANLTLPDGGVVPNAELVSPPSKPRTYAFCSDTLFNEEIVPFIKDVDLLYYEATFDHSRLQRAIETFHSTAIQAATIAQMAKAGQLVIGHFSSRYREPELEALLQETRSVFPNSELAIEGTIFVVEKS